MGFKTELLLWALYISSDKFKHLVKISFFPAAGIDDLKFQTHHQYNNYYYFSSIPFKK